MAKQKQDPNKIISSGKAAREFAYTKGNISLSFTLRIDKADNQHELRTFLELLKRATLDVGEQISSLQ